MVYTCFEMIRDCRADRPEGWSCFITNYAPVIRRLVLHYRPKRAGDIDDVLLAIREPGASAASLFASVTPAPEREFLAELRQQVAGSEKRVALLVQHNDAKVFVPVDLG